MAPSRRRGEKASAEKPNADGVGGLDHSDVFRRALERVERGPARASRGGRPDAKEIGQRPARAKELDAFMGAAEDAWRAYRADVERAQTVAASVPSASMLFPDVDEMRRYVDELRSRLRDSSKAPSPDGASLARMLAEVFPMATWVETEAMLYALLDVSPRMVPDVEPDTFRKARRRLARLLTGRPDVILGRGSRSRVPS